MKIQFYGHHCFGVSSREASFLFRPTEKEKNVDVDFVISSFGEVSDIFTKAKKVLSLPGEFEISGALIRGFFSDDSRENVVYKVISEDVSCVFFGRLNGELSSDFLKKLGENVDVVFLLLHDKFSAKDAKTLIEYLSPRFAFLGGDSSFFSKMVEVGAKILGESTFSFSSVDLREEKLDMFILTSVP